jgi:hypothetical protein
MKIDFGFNAAPAIGTPVPAGLAEIRKNGIQPPKL